MIKLPSQILDHKQEQENFKLLQEELPYFVFDFLVSKNHTPYQNDIQYYYKNSVKDKDVLKCLEYFSNIDEKLKDPASKIEADILKIAHILAPFLKPFEHSQTIEIGVCGGALRELVHHKADKIKDLDITISILDVASINNLSSSVDELNDLLEKSNIPRLNWTTLACRFSDNEFFYREDREGFPICDENNFARYIISTMCAHVLKHQFQSTKSYSCWDLILQEKERRGLAHATQVPYKMTHLSAVIKIEDKTFNYPIDLLFINQAVGDYMEKSFDYGLCCISSSKNINDLILNSASWLTDDIYVMPRFLNDFINQEITYYAQNFNLSEIQDSIENHYSRILTKYPNYNFNYAYYPEGNGNYNLEKGQFLKAFKNFENLNTKIGTTDTKIVKHKI